MPRSSANVETVELLKQYLELAENNGFSSVAIAIVCHPGYAAIDVAGDISLLKGTKEGVDALSESISFQMDHYALPERDESLDKSYVCYDACRGPLGFDFLTWLIDAEMTRKRENAPGPLKVAFWTGKSAEVVGDPLIHVRRWHWIKNVFRPLLPMIGAVEDQKAIRGHSKAVYVSRDILKAARAGEEVPKLHTDHQCPVDCENYITITLRESCYWTHRNSNLVAWTQFALDLQKQGERVIFVRDTERAEEPLEGFETCPMASVGLASRQSLYQKAKANLFVSNGPATMAVFGDKPWLQFIPVEPDDSAFIGNTPKFWRDSMGIEVGSQYPWAHPDQRIIWAKDDYEEITRAWMTNKSS